MEAKRYRKLQVQGRLQKVWGAWQGYDSVSANVDSDVGGVEGKAVQDRPREVCGAWQVARDHAVANMGSGVGWWV